MLNYESVIILRHFIATLGQRRDVMTLCQLIQSWEGSLSRHQRMLADFLMPSLVSIPSSLLLINSR